MEREDLRFSSGDAECAAWLYRPAGDGPAPCIAMAHGFSLTRHDGLPGYAEALAQAGAAVLLFDHRFLGDSGGVPRQHFRAAKQLEDYRNAIAFARTLPGIDPRRILVWGYSFSGGTAVNAAAADPNVAGAILLCPFLDGLARVIDSVRVSPSNVAWILPLAVRDQLGNHQRIPVTAPLGQRGAMNFAGEYDGFQAAVKPESPWRNEIAPGVFATIALHRPLSNARKLHCPVWIGLCERDISVSNRAVAKLAQRVPTSELHRYDCDHFQPFYDGDFPSRIAGDQAEWLRRTILGRPAAITSAV